MFIVELNYLKPLSEVERFLPEHKRFLQHNYANGNFLLSGRKEPRSGGIIISCAKTRTEIDSLIDADPFKREGIAEYTVIEFIPSMASPALEFLLKA